MNKKGRWRLPLGHKAYTELTGSLTLRICREVATEKRFIQLAMAHFMNSPAENADGYAKIRPIASHSFRIHDYASYRGLLVMTGIDIKKAKVTNISLFRMTESCHLGRCY